MFRPATALLWSSAVALLAGGAAYAADQTPVQLKEVTVAGQAMEPANDSFTVDVVECKLIEERHVSDTLCLIEQVPGVYKGAV